MMTDNYRVSVLEAATRPRGPLTRSLDRLYIGESLVAVVDGATPKAGVSFEETEDFLAIVIGCLSSAERSEKSLPEFIKDFCERTSHLQLSRTEPTRRPSATIAVVNARRREVWRVGDAWIMMNGVSLDPDTEGERQVAAKRQEAIKHLLGKGVSVTALRDDDLGRAAILNEIVALGLLRNSNSPGGFGALDGCAVNSHFEEVWPLTAATSRITLATDGYLSASPNLKDAELALERRISSDPLMIDDPPATKGVRSSDWSFDDRTFVSLEVRYFDSSD